MSPICTEFWQDEIESVNGYGARISAPGYLDSTEWCVFDTEAQAQAYLDEMYPENEDEDTGLYQSPKEMKMTVSEYITSYKQESARAEIAIGRLTQQLWCKARVLEILAPMSYAAVRHLMVEHMKFAGIFTAGHQIADWCYEELKRRDADGALPAPEWRIAK